MNVSKNVGICEESYSNENDQLPVRESDSVSKSSGRNLPGDFDKTDIAEKNTSDEVNKQQAISEAGNPNQPNESSIVESPEKKMLALNQKTFLRLYRNQLSKYDLREVEFTSEFYYYHTSAKGDSQCDDAGDDIMIPNDHIKFRYMVEEKISLGTYGTVVKATDCKYGNHVAIKVAKKGIQYKICAKDEVTMLMYLNHFKSDDAKNIVQLYNYFFYRDHMFLTFELLGKDLSSIISENTKGINRNYIRTIVQSILAGLKFLHQNKVIHGDLKPNNVALVLGNPNRCKILDFGLSMFASATSFHALPHLHYRAPEILLTAPFDYKVDIFALGCIITEMTAGYKVFYAHCEIIQLYNYIEIFGFPPRSILSLAVDARKFFWNPTGELKLKNILHCKIFEPYSRSLESVLNIFDDPHFIAFIKQCYLMDPAKRSSAEELLMHPWMGITP